MKEFISKVGMWAVFIAAFFLPLKTTLSNLGLIIAVAISIVSIAMYGGQYNVLKSLRFYLLAPIVLFVPVLLGLLYTDDINEGAGLLGKQIFFLITPLIFLKKDCIQTNYRKWISGGLMLGGLISMIFLHFNNIGNIINDEISLSELNFLGYSYTGLKFVAPLKDMHPVYLGSYYITLLALLWDRKFKLKKYLKVITTIITIVTIVFLNSRIIFLCFFILIFAYGILYYKESRNYIRIGLVVFFILGVFIKKTYVFNKLVKGTVWELTDNVATKGLDTKKVGDSRMARWEVAIDLIKQKPIFGHGTGMERELLTKAYQQKGMNISYENQFNAHNQYLGYAIDYGIFGLFFLLSFIGWNVYLALSKKQLDYFLFIFIISACCLTENFLIRNMGVNFVVIFALIYIKPNVEKN